MIRSALVYHVFSGQIFFSAIALFVIGIAGGRRTRLLSLLAIPLALLSGTPMRLIFAVPLVLLSIAAIAANRNGWRGSMNSVGAAFLALVKIGAIGASFVAASYELRHQRAPRDVERPTRLIVVGDSLASGGFGEMATWPMRLGIRGVANLSRPSETAPSAVEHLTSFGPPRPGDAVMIEIGGNDMLDRRSAAEFERALDEMVRRSAPRKVIVVELPVYPGGWAFAAAQRRVAAKYGATVVPKRVLALALAGEGNTRDGLHLTDRGHAVFAQAVRDELGW